MENQKVWFITGASKGFGLELVKQLLNAGNKVAATSRTVEELVKAAGGEQPGFLPLAMDLINENSVKEAIEKTIAEFGQIDVIVNNAGYGLLGGVEELTDEEVRKNFDINVFGSLNVIRQALPHMRTKRSGHVFNISSIGGFVGSYPGAGIYCSTKFAVNGFSEALYEELKPFGIHVTIVQPGYFRTNFLSKGSMATPGNPIAEYDNVRQSVDMHQNQIDQQQPGDPVKGVAAIIKVASAENPPLNLFLGADAYQVAQDKIAYVQKDLDNWKAVTVSTGFEEAAV
ncbi:oxidoreductase [Mucilaginibacter sp. RS28]|uniref:Oxidoreductase n=1 Tax=Mucilaginibacter straminoryzae TaxID=2932774 RepID=A0A9X1X443_9SPHI|nr:oxidoreductase [Mucilaginibacter straminoryzae]MCJ8209815.1 oxidoreductase [Mucilaginibacter straminoryzae]